MAASTNSSALSNAIIESQVDYSVFTGADIVAYMGHKRVATLQGITVSITREIMPVFCMGDPNPKAFAKGKRAIAGNLVFTQFDRHAILKAAAFLLGSNQPNYIGDLSGFSLLANGNSTINLNGVQTTQVNPAGLSSNILANNVTNSAGVNLGAQSQFATAVAQEIAETYALIGAQRLQYSDQVPPFDVTITMVNDQGQSAYTAVQGVQLVNEGWGYTLDDLNSEAGFTFVARSVTPLDTLYSTTGTAAGLSANSTKSLFGGF